MTVRPSRPEPRSVRLLWVTLFLCVASFPTAITTACSSGQRSRNVIENTAYRLTVKAASDGLHAVLEDKRSGLRLADGPMVYRTDAAGHENPATLFQLVDATVSVEGQKLVIRGTLAGLRVEHVFSLPTDKPVMDETLRLTNPTAAVVSLPDLECGLTRVLKDEKGGIPEDMAGDRFVAVPHRKRAEAAKEIFLDFSSSDMADKPGFEAHPDQVQDPHYSPSRHRYSDGWSWTHGNFALGIYKYSQEAMLFSVLSTAKTGGRTLLRFGGTAMIMGEPAVLTRLKPGQTADLGLTHYETFTGGYGKAMYGYRRLLDERGCRFPASYDPPVHWEQLYDMEGAWDHRATQYTRAIIEREAQKGVDYSCEAIYLDPGWDTKFASFIWGDKWLGPMPAFVNEMRDRFGLKVSLHTPLATWMSLDIPMGPPSIDTWPAEARLIAPPAPAPLPGAKPAARRLPAICLGSRQYLDAAEKRLLDLCAGGAIFLMYDGNFWNGGCLDPNHGHPVPYTYEDHIRANVDLAQRIHAKYPSVLIEMHDMLAGGNPVRDTPLYYTYGLPGSWDENWGYELMWDSMADIKALRCLSLYYSNLSSNIPFYLHVNLRGDNTDAIVLWWYASTCRHLGIGGTDKNPAVVAAQKAAMKRYHAVEALYKRGEFYGISEEIHVHVLGDRVAVNAFNLDDKARTIEGSIGLSELGLDPKRAYVFDETWVRAEEGRIVVKADLGPWGAKMASAEGGAPTSVQAGSAVFRIGRRDGGYSEFAIAGRNAAYPREFPHDVEFVVGRSRPERDWPFVHPGPLDTWAGGRAHALAIVFDMPKPVSGYYRFVADFVDTHSSAPPVLTIDINGTRLRRRLPPGASDASLTAAKAGKAYSLEQLIPSALLHAGKNSITLLNAEGSWALYDDIRLESGAPAPAEPLRVQGQALPFYKRTPGGLLRALKVSVDNLAGGSAPAEILWRAGRDHGSQTLDLRFGPNELSLLVPDVAERKAVELEVRAAGREAKTTAALEPSRKWRVFIVPTVHTDIGYTDLQDRVMARHAENTLAALAMADRFPGFRWDFETFIQLDYFLRAHPDKSAEVFGRLREGRMGLSAFFGNMLTGLCSHEALSRATLDARVLADRGGFAFRSVILDDVPSAVGSLPMVLANSGIKYFIEGVNNDRAPYATEGLRGPFHWEGPDGSRLLSYILPGYAVAGGLISSMERAAEALPGFLAGHENAGYPYDAVLVNGAFSDNQGIASWLPEVVEKWNAEWEYPKLILGRPEEFFAAIEKPFASKIPVLQTDFGGWWEDGAASSARETALCRRAEERAVTAEMLHSLAAVLSGAPYPKPGFDELWRNILLYDEHTWGAWCSVSEPASEQTVKQWDVKSSFARQADGLSRSLLREGLGKLAAMVPAADLVVFNPLSWTRKDIVLTDLPGALEDLTTRMTLPGQALPEGGGCFIAEDLPSVGYRSYRRASEGGSFEAAARVAGNEMENEFYRVRVDPRTGGLQSVFDKEAGRELVDAASEFRLGELVYVSGGEGSYGVHSDLKGLPAPQFMAHRQVATALRSTNGPVFAELTSEATAEKMPKITLRIRLFRGLKRLDLRVEVDKEETTAKEAVYMAFPFAMDVDKGGLWLEYPDAVTEPLKDQHASACRDWLSVQRWLAASDGGATVILSPLDSPLVTLGGLTGSTWPRQLSLKRAHVFAYLMNNYWHTNYKASQGGKLVFRFSLTSRRGAFAKGEAVARGWELFSPPVSGPGQKGQTSVLAASAKDIASVKPAGLPLMAIKPAEDGSGFIFRFWDLAGAGGPALLSLPKAAQQAFLCDLVETNGREQKVRGAVVEAPIRAYGPLTLKIRFSR